jgi:tetratricopeptide (TPR) repeat protein
MLMSVLGVFAAAAGIHVLHLDQVRRHATKILSYADRCENDGEIDRSLRYLGQYLRLVPNDYDVLVRLALGRAKIAVTPKSLEEAFVLLDRAVARSPDRADARLALARVAIQFGRYRDALGHLSELEQRDPNDAELVRLHAQAEIGNARYDAAAATFRRALELDPVRVATYVSLAELLRERLDRSVEADELMNALVERDPASPDAYLARARYWARYQDRDAARADVRRAIEHAPERRDALQLGAEMATEDGDYETARGYLETALRVDPTAAELYVARSVIDTAAGQVDRAIETIRRGLDQVGRDDVSLQWTLAGLYITAGRVAESDALIAQLAKSELPSHVLDYLRASLLREQRQYLQAARIYERTLERLADRPDLQVLAIYYLAGCYAPLGQPDLAIAHYRRVVRMRPRWGAARWTLAEQLAAAGRFDEALAECGAARAIAAPTPAGWALLLRLLVWQQRVRPAAERSWQAIEQARKLAVQAWPDSPEVSIAVADCLFAEGRMQEAVDRLEGAATRHAESDTLRVALALLYDRVGQRDDATALLDKIEAANGDSLGLRLAKLVRLDATQATAATLQSLAADAENFSHTERVTLLRLVGRAALQFGHRDLARTLLEKLAATADYDLGSRLLLFELALVGGDDAAMRQWVDQIRAIEGPQGALWRVGEASRLIATPRDQDSNALGRASVLLEEARSRRPNWGRVYLNIAQLEEARGQPDRAIDAYLQAFALGERRLEALRRLVGLLNSGGRFAEAARVMRQLTSDDRLPVELHNVASVIFLRSGDYEAAVDQARRYAAAQPDDYRGQVWLGQLLGILGRDADAESALRAALRMAPQEIAVWTSLVSYLAQRGKTEQARTVIEEARHNLPAERADLGMAACFEVLGDVERAATHIHSAVSGGAEAQATWRVAGEFYARHNRWNEAETSLRQALSLAPHNADVRRTLAIVLGSRGQYRAWLEAVKLVDANLAERPASREDRRAKAILLSSRESSRNQHQAIALFEGLVDQSFLTAADRHLFARLYFARGDLVKGRALMLDLLAQEPNNTEYLRTYLSALVARGEVREALKWMASLEKLAPAATETVFLKARLLAAQEQTTEAAKLLQQHAAHLVASGQSASRLLEVARQCESIGAGDAAGEIYLRYRTDWPDGALPYAVWLAGQGRHDEAIAACDHAWDNLPADRVAIASVRLIRAMPASDELQRRVESRLVPALEQQPDSGRLRLALAALRDTQTRYSEATALYRAVLDAEPENLMALNNLAWLRTHCERDARGGLALIERAIESYGPSADLLDTRGVILTAMGQAGKAIQDLEEAHALSREPHVTFHLAQAYHVAGQVDRARETLRAVSDTDRLLSQLHATERPGYQKLVAALGI